jgi:uncharacterized protein YqeY
MATLFSKIQEDLNCALKEDDKIKVSTLRLLISAFNNAKIAKGSELTDEEITKEIAKEAKRHQESIEAFKKGAREDLVNKESQELKVLEVYLPKKISETELIKIVDEVISESGAKGMSEMGNVMGKVMAKVEGRADGRVVSDVVRSKLQSN